MPESWVILGTTGQRPCLDAFQWKLKLADARKCSNDELVDLISKHVPKDLRSDLPRPPTKAQLAAAHKEMAAFVRDHIGSLITTASALKRTIENSSANQRAPLLRAIAGGLQSPELWACCPGGPVNIALRAWSVANNLQDASLLSAWALNAGRKRRKKDDVWQQPVGDAVKSKRLRK